ncbi:MAG: MaoC family dehydratase [Bacillota bacterium]|nr:MaoC family dehydratase [Bacillota bacterium]
MSLLNFRVGPLPKTLGLQEVKAYMQAVSCQETLEEIPLWMPPAAAALYLTEIIGALLRDPGAGVALERLIHLEQSFSFLQPVAVGETLYLEGWVASAQERRGQTFFTVAMEGRKTPGGELSLSGTSRLLLRKGEEG